MNAIEARRRLLEGHEQLVWISAARVDHLTDRGYLAYLDELQRATLSAMGRAKGAIAEAERAATQRKAATESAAEERRLTLDERRIALQERRVAVAEQVHRLAAASAGDPAPKLALRRGGASAGLLRGLSGAFEAARQLRPT